MQSKAPFILKLIFCIKFYKIYGYRTVYSFINLWLMSVTKFLGKETSVTGSYLSPGIIYKDYTCS